MNNSTTRIKNALFFLLRQGLWGVSGKENAEHYFPLSPEEWQALYIHSRRQAVQGIVYDGMLLLPRSLYPPHALILRWTLDIDQWERINKQHIQVLGALQRFFATEPSIPFEVIKGLALSCYYPQPLHRVCGDIDLYFGCAEAVQKAAQKLEASGVYVKYGANDDAACCIGQVSIELHPELIELHSPFIQKALRNWENRVFCTATVDIQPEYNGVHISVPTPEAHHLLVSTHILKHLLNEGIGLRQLCDAAILLKGLAKETNRAELERLCHQFGIWRWSCLLYSFLADHLGLAEEYLPFRKHYDTSNLMTEIWESGNFGFYDERKKQRPEGKWKNKWYTTRQIARKMQLFFTCAPAETFWWPTLLTLRRIKELFSTHENHTEKNTK